MAIAVQTVRTTTVSLNRCVAVLHGSRLSITMESPTSSPAGKIPRTTILGLRKPPDLTRNPASAVALRTARPRARSSIG